MSASQSGIYVVNQKLVIPYKSVYHMHRLLYNFQSSTMFITDMREAVELVITRIESGTSTYIDRIEILTSASSTYFAIEMLKIRTKRRE